MKSQIELSRVAYSPGEFATLFGKSQTWGYRQIYGGKVNAITEHGRILIPAKEVEKVLESAGIYSGKEKPKQQKARISKLNAEEKGVWKRFIASRRGGTGAVKSGVISKSGPGPATQNASSRKSVIMRVGKAWSKQTPAR